MSTDPGVAAMYPTAGEQPSSEMYKSTARHGLDDDTLRHALNVDKQISRDPRKAPTAAEGQAALQKAFGDQAPQVLAQAQAYVKANPELKKFLARGLGSDPQVVLAIAKLARAKGRK